MQFTEVQERFILSAKISQVSVLINDVLNSTVSTLACESCVYLSSTD